MLLRIKLKEKAVYCSLVFVLLFICGCGESKKTSEDTGPKIKKYIAEGDKYFMKKDYDKSLASWEKAIALNPKENTYLYNNMAIAYYMFLKKPEKAKLLWEKEIKVNPEDYLPYTGLGNYYRDRGDYVKAIRNYKKSISLNANYFMAHQNLGDAYFLDKKYDLAEKTLKKAAELMTGNYSVQYSLGRVYSSTGKYAKAEMAWKKSIKIMPMMYLAHYELGKLYAKRNSLAQSIQYFKKAIKFKPDFAEAYNGLAYLYANKKMNLAEAEKMVEKAISINEKGSYVYLDTLGWIYYRQNRFEDAERKIRAAITLSEKEHMDDTSLLAEEYYHLGMVLLKTGRKEEASKSLSKALGFSTDAHLTSQIRHALTS